MLEFILNNTHIQSLAPRGLTLLDFVRYERQLTGTKIGCREGDCGACVLLMGELINGKMRYRSVTSCITPLVNAHGKHVVSIEGLNMEQLSPCQMAMVEESGTQCGFCTVGFIVSFMTECLSGDQPSYPSLISAIDGNICRCTGYKSIERASKKILSRLKDKDLTDPVRWCTDNDFVPVYFNTIPFRLKEILTTCPSNGSETEAALKVGGGTDLIVQKHDEVFESRISSFADQPDLRMIQIQGNKCVLGGSVTATDMMESSVLIRMFPDLRNYLKLVASTPIRNTGTIAGNLANASPIGDLTIFFLALNSSVVLKSKSDQNRELPLKDFYKDYKILDITDTEYIAAITFIIPGPDTIFNFEKVSKRTFLDIASVNSGMSITLTNNKVLDIHISAGGVAPIPKYLERTRDALMNKELSSQNLIQAIKVAQKEISPISDARGAQSYKRLLLRQLIWAHFIKLRPEIFTIEQLSKIES